MFTSGKYSRLIALKKTNKKDLLNIKKMYYWTF